MVKNQLVKLVLFIARPKVGVPLLIACVVLFGPFVFRQSRLAGLPDIGDPFDVEEFGSVKISPEENAFVLYQQAVDLLRDPPPSSSKSDWKTLDADCWSDVAENLQQWVADNQQALQLWREATERPRFLYKQPKDLTYDDFWPIIMPPFREYARLAVLEGKRQEAAGDLAEAWRWYRAILRMGRHLHMKSVVIGI